MTRTSSAGTATIGETFSYQVTVPAVAHTAPIYDVRVLDDLELSAADLEFETAGQLRDEIRRLEAVELGLSPSEAGRSLQAAAPRGAAPQKSKANYKMRAKINAPIQPRPGKPKRGR